MPSAASNTTLVKCQKAIREHVPAGTTESWVDVRTIRASVQYDTQFWRRDNQTAGEGEVLWVIRSRDSLGDMREVSKVRYTARVDGRLMALYPKGFPIKKGNEFMVICVEEEDTKLPDPGFNRQGNW